ncbi:sensor domain-containing diguanylate cyclase, partial [Azoarcus taiwanensis]
ADVRRRELLALALPVSVALLAVGLLFVIALRRGWRRERALKLDLQSNLLWLESAQQAAGIGHFAIDPVIGTVHMSSLCQDIFGVRDDEITMAQWLSLIDAEDRGELKTVLARVRSGEDATRVQCRILPVDDRTALRWGEIGCRAFDQERPGDPRVIGIAQDITDRKAVEAELAGYRRRLEAQVRLDALTGLSNRRALDEAAAFQLAQAVRGGTPLALMMIDVDFLGKRIKWLILPLHESETDRHLIGLSG